MQNPYLAPKRNWGSGRGDIERDGYHSLRAGYRNGDDFMKKRIPLFPLLVILILALSPPFSPTFAANRWAESKAIVWYQRYPWILGCNFIPSTAVNQLEMWQGETFDPVTIERELGWAADLGFNTVRVYLHDLPWVTDWDGFRGRINRFLDIASKQKIMVVFVLLDDCWNTNPTQGSQPAPVPGVHNSRWVQSPGTRVVSDPDLWLRIERYVKDIIRAFATDQRVLMWDLYNEPGNTVHGKRALPLLEKVFEWAREIGPSQPLTAGVFDGCDGDIEDFIIENSDILTFHNYEGEEQLVSRIRDLKKENRPLICTEWMARTRGSTIETHLPIFKKERVGCLSWGLVSGKTQTIYPWDSKEGSPAPEVWFQDMLKPDGKPFDPSEIDMIRALTGKKPTAT